MLQENRIDDDWNVDMDRTLSKTSQRDICGPVRDQQNYLRICGLKFWSKMGKAAQKKGKNGRTRRQNSTML